MNSNLSSIVLGILTPALRVVVKLGSIVGAVCSFVGSNFRLIGNQPGSASPSERHPDVAVQPIPLVLGEQPLALALGVGDDP